MKGKKSRVIIITFVTINGSQIDHKCELNRKYIKMQQNNLLGLVKRQK